MGEEYVAPRNEIEQELATIWCQILKLDCVGIHDDFFHLGGHSILTISLISNINQIFKLSLAVAWSFEYTTIAEQAYFILRENPSLKEYKFIIKISSPNGLIPLFLIPPAGGGAEVYLSMGKLFNTKDSLISAIYAIESYNLYHLDKPIESLKLLANKYIKYIKTIQPKGPYFLGGWSLGGTIAYEIANQLKNRGELILGVYIIDTKAIDPAVWEKIEVLKTPNNFRKNLKVLGISDAEIPQLLKLNSIEEKLLLTYTLPKSKDIAIILMQALKFETSSDKRG
nr:thioesterase domain-containing protein [Coxiella burnetii]